MSRILPRSWPALLLGALLGLGAAGCGQMGPLTLPAEAPAEAPAAQGGEEDDDER